MKIISHRGNLWGPDPFKLYENTHEQYKKVMNETPFDIELDVMYYPKFYLSSPLEPEKVFLGHPENDNISQCEEYYFTDNRLVEILNNPRVLWHCKNLQTLRKFTRITEHIMGDFFSNDLDSFVLSCNQRILYVPKLEMKSVTYFHHWEIGEGYHKTIIVLPEQLKGFDIKLNDNIGSLRNFSAIMTDYPIYLQKKCDELGI